MKHLKEPKIRVYSKTVLHPASELDEPIRRHAHREWRSLDEEASYLMSTALGMSIKDSCIVKTGDRSYMYFSPVGVFGSATEEIFERMLDGCAPMTGSDWTGDFETLDEAANAAGEVVCIFSYQMGLVLRNPSEFIRMWLYFRPEDADESTAEYVDFSRVNMSI